MLRPFEMRDCNHLEQMVFANTLWTLRQLDVCELPELVQPRLLFIFQPLQQPARHCNALKRRNMYEYCNTSYYFKHPL